MLAKSRLIDLLHEDYSRYQKILIILAVSVDNPKRVAQIKRLGSEAGLKEIHKWQPGSVLHSYKNKGLAVPIKEGWKLTDRGKRYLTEELNLKIKPERVTSVSASLRKLLEDIDGDTEDFLKEAISCFECNNYRASVVLSWVGAMSILQQYVVDNKLTEFNKEAKRRNGKWKNAKLTDDLCRMKEIEFLNILADISEKGKNVKQELEKCLSLRNSCGHPN